MSMDAKRLDEIRERMKKASPAEYWSARDMDLAEACGRGWWADAVFAEKARTDVPDLVAEVEANQAAMQRASAELRHAFRAKADWNLVARAIEILERATTPSPEDRS